MRSRREIMDESSPNIPKGIWGNTKLIIEVLLDIREYLEDIRNK